ncbi:probable polygalacturonase [Tanacetum coccineum]
MMVGCVVDLEIHGLGLVIVAIEKKLVVVLVGIVETVPASSTRSVFWLEYLALLDRFHECNELQLSGTTHINSPKLHMSIVDYEDVDIRYRKIVAPGDSPNTDGIDVSASTRINIHDSNIQTGDDCVAINGGVYDIKVTEELIDERSTWDAFRAAFPVGTVSVSRVRELEYEVQMVHLHCCSLAYIILTELESHVLKQRI